MKRVAGPIAAGVVAFAACGSDDGDLFSGVNDEASTTSEPTPSTEVEDDLRISGLFVLIDSDISGSWRSCSGTGGYSDFGPGMNVTIRDEAQTIVGSGSTRSASSADRDDPRVQERIDLADEYGVSCPVVFDVEVDEAEFYTVEVGRRGELSYSRDELETLDWWVELSLGD